MKKLFFGAILVFTNPAFAELNPEPTIDPKVTAEDGKPIVATWKDGREAESKIRIVPSLTGNIPLSIYENSCTGITTNKCVFTFGVTAYQVHMQWTKHPDTGKIGKTLTYQYQGSSTKTDFVAPLANSILVPAEKVRRPIAAKSVPDDHLSCEDYKFLPNDPMQAPFTRIIRWENEIMFNNPETDGTENRSIGGALDLELVPHADRSALLIKVHGGYVSALQGSNPLFAGDILSLTLRDKNQKICQIGIKPDLSGLSNLANNYLANLPTNYEPYALGRDEFTPKVKSEIKKVLENTTYITVE